MTTTHPVDLVEAYIAEVKARLDGVPDEERAELLDDVAAHVREVADEHGADQLRARLGSPEQFGDELRASAGFAPAPTTVASQRVTSRVARLMRAGRETAVVRALIKEWPRLEPAWWLLRGVAAVWLVAGVSGADNGLIPRVGGGLLGLLLIVGGAAGSYALGIRAKEAPPRGLRRTRITIEVCLALFALSYVASASETRYVYYDSSAGAQPDACLRDSAGRAIGNLYGYDLAGNLINDFFLVDQAGRPIDNLCPDQADADSGNPPAQTTYARDTNGAPVYNVFPRAQQRTTVDVTNGKEIGTAPVAPPAVVFPQVEPRATQTTQPTTTTVVTEPQP